MEQHDLGTTKDMAYKILVDTNIYTNHRKYAVIYFSHVMLSA
jgi:hypothetical protein